MELIKIVPSESKLWEQVWRLYNESFPEYERRRISSHARACEDAEFDTRIVVDNGNLLALLFSWKCDDFIYVEHIAVNPQMRGKKIGTSVLQLFLDQNKGRRVILEIDPPVDDISRRRLDFYSRLGFVANDYDYGHPSYTKGGQAHKLVILSRPGPISREEFQRFSDYVKEKVLLYID